MEMVKPGDAYKLMALAVAEAGGCTVSRLGLRFDRVALRVLDQLGSFVDGRLPEGVAVLLTTTAPIRTPTQVVSRLRDELAVLAEVGGGGLEHSIKLAEGAAKLRFIEGLPQGAPKFLGFVHNPSVDAKQIMDRAEQWMRSCAERSALKSLLSART